MRRTLAATCLAVAAVAAVAPSAHAVDVVKCVLTYNSVDPEHGGNTYLDPGATVHCIRPM